MSHHHTKSPGCKGDQKGFVDRRFKQPVVLASFGGDRIEGGSLEAMAALAVRPSMIGKGGMGEVYRAQSSWVCR